MHRNDPVVNVDLSVCYLHNDVSHVEVYLKFFTINPQLLVVEGVGFIHSKGQTNLKARRLLKLAALTECW